MSCCDENKMLQSLILIGPMLSLKWEKEMNKKEVVTSIWHVCSLFFFSFEAITKSLFSIS